MNGACDEEKRSNVCLRKSRVKWARGSINKDVKIYVGVPGSSSAAGAGYVDSATLKKYIDVIHKNATAPSFGGVMIWDAGTVMSTCSGYCPRGHVSV